MIIFGGLDEHEQPINDIGVLDLDSMNWIEESNVNPPSPRAAPGVFIESINALLIYGGYTGFIVNEIWLFTLDANSTKTTTCSTTTATQTTQKTEILADTIDKSNGNTEVSGRNFLIF